MSPFKPKRPCSHPGCPRLTDGGKCEEHQKQEQRQYDQERDQTEARQWIHSPRWRKASKAFLVGHPLCAECERQGRTKAAYLVDHIRPHRGDYKLFWSESNWQGLCNPCHEEKHKEDRWR